MAETVVLFTIISTTKSQLILCLCNKRAITAGLLYVITKRNAPQIPDVRLLTKLIGMLYLCPIQYFKMQIYLLLPKIFC